MKYGLATFMRKISEFNQLKKTNPRYSAALKPYNYRTVEEFIQDYEGKRLKGKKGGTCIITCERTLKP